MSPAGTPDCPTPLSICYVSFWDLKTYSGINGGIPPFGTCFPFQYLPKSKIVTKLRVIAMSPTMSLSVVKNPPSHVQKSTIVFLYFKDYMSFQTSIRSNNIELIIIERMATDAVTSKSNQSGKTPIPVNNCLIPSIP